MKISTFFLVALIANDSFAVRPVYFGNELPPEELQYTSERNRMNQEAISEFIGERLEKDINVSIGFSGGGLRSAIFSIAMLRALQEIELYDGLRYMMGVSGSAWMILDLLARNLSLDDFNSLFQKRLAVDHGNPGTYDWMSIFQAMQIKKLQGESVSLVDFYGCMVADALFPDLEGKGQGVSIESFRKGLHGAKYPFPIVAVSLTGDGISEIMPWAEITPFYFGSQYQGSYVDTMLLGNHFSKCIPTTEFPVQKLSYVFGLVGTFYAVSPNEIATVSPVVREILKYDPSFGFRHLAPSKVPNFLYQCGDSPLKKYEELDVIDAGHEANFGIISLLRKGRVPDIILTGAAAHNAQARTYPELFRASIYARNHGLPFPDIRKPTMKIGNYIDVFRGKNGAPTIIYYANPVRFSTLKPTYTEFEYNELSDAIFDLVRQSRPVLKELIRDVNRSGTSV